MQAKTMSEQWKKEDNLKSWKPGQSGNPKGRPKGRKSLDTRIKEFLNSELEPEIANKIREAGINLSEPTREQALLAALFAEVTKGNVKAAETLLDRAYGKPAQKIEQEIGIHDPEKRKALEEKLQIMKDEVNKDE